MNQTELLGRLETSYLDAVRTKDDLIRSGPFLISLNPAMKLPWLNNAVVADDTLPVNSASIRAMISEFEKRDRMPRMELFQELRPEIVQELLAEGFEIECVLPVMVCIKDEFIPQRSAGIELEMMGPDSEIESFIRVIDIAFEHDEPVSPKRIEGMKESLRKGSQLSAMARIDGTPAAVASLVVGGDVAELAGVGTHPDFRRRGAASTVSTYLLEEFFRVADLAWLSAGDETSKLVYERLGFRLVGNQVNVSRPSVED